VTIPAGRARARAHGATERLRVAMVTPRYLPQIGGVEQHVHEVATRIADSGAASVTVITSDLGGRLPARAKDGRVEVRRVPAYPRGRDWLFAPGIVPAVARGGWDIVHVQSYHTFVAPLAMGAAGAARVPYVLTFHGGGHSDRLRHAGRGVQRRVLRPLLTRAAALVAVARFEIDEYGAELAIPAGRFVYIPNGVDLSAAPTDAAPPAPALGPLIASVGRLERYKGHHRVIEALPHVLGEYPDARIWIAGAGPYEPELRALASELGVADRVDISAVAADDRTEMARRLGAVDLVVLLSGFETHPIAALEALSLGRPLLVASGSGLSEMADRGLARAIDADATPAAVGAAMTRELRDPLVPGTLDLPTWDDCAARLLELYRSVAGRRRCGS
jgi:glycosyltransferase involved in cell wall biosynthesis